MGGGGCWNGLGLKVSDTVDEWTSVHLRVIFKGMLNSALLFPRPRPSSVVRHRSCNIRFAARVMQRRALEAAEKLSHACHPDRSEGPLHLNFQANTEVLRRLLAPQDDKFASFSAAC